jgi:transaldolase
VNTAPENTLNAFADHGEVDTDWVEETSGSEGVLDGFRRAGIDLDALGKRLQDEGAASFVASWNDLLRVIAERSKALSPRHLEKAS